MFRRHPFRDTGGTGGVNNIRQLPRMWSVTQIRRWHGTDRRAVDFDARNRPAITIVSTDQTNSAAVAQYIFNAATRCIVRQR